MSKRIISLLIALTLILCLGACSKAPAAPAITGSGTADDPWTIGATNPVINTELTGNIEMFVYYEK